MILTTFSAAFAALLSSSTVISWAFNYILVFNSQSTRRLFAFLAWQADSGELCLPCCDQQSFKLYTGFWSPVKLFWLFFLPPDRFAISTFVFSRALNSIPNFESRSTFQDLFFCWTYRFRGSCKLRRICSLCSAEPSTIARLFCAFQALLKKLSQLTRCSP